MGSSIQEELISKGFANGHAKGKNRPGEGPGRGFQGDGRGGGGKGPDRGQDVETRKIIKAITDSTGTLKSILRPEVYALPTRSNGEKGWALAVAHGFRGVGKPEDAIKSSQLRKVFGEIKNIQRRLGRVSFEELKSEIWRILPLVAYAYARGVVKRDFYNLMKALVNEEKIKTEKDYESFVDFYEAIIAYFNVD